MSQRSESACESPLRKKRQTGWIGHDVKGSDSVAEAWKKPMIGALFENDCLRGTQTRPLNMSVHCYGSNAWRRGLKAERCEIVRHGIWKLFCVYV